MAQKNTKNKKKQPIEEKPIFTLRIYEDHFEVEEGPLSEEFCFNCLLKEISAQVAKECNPHDDSNEFGLSV